jgi:TRAP-type mannitol/chloroaromatic compound transport system permease large subunit
MNDKGVAGRGHVFEVILEGLSSEAIRMMDVYRASLPYIYLTILELVLFIIFPGIVTWLPRHMRAIKEY